MKITIVWRMGWMSWNFVRFHKILLQIDAKSFSCVSWKTKVLFLKKNLLSCSVQMCQKMAFAVLIFSEGFDKGDDFVVLDGFHAPPIESGVGTAQASIFLDGNHTRVRTHSIVWPHFYCTLSHILPGLPLGPKPTISPVKKISLAVNWVKVIKNCMQNSDFQSQFSTCIQKISESFFSFHWRTSI